MRHLRWKRKYFSGLKCLDLPKKALYQDLQSLHTEMEQKEHCQDMKDLAKDLNGQARNLFETIAGSCKQARGIVDEHKAAISQTLDQRLPLQALETPACRECDICERTGELVGNWVVKSASPDEEERDASS